MKTVIHEMRNQLAVAVANIEAFIDGKLEPTPQRLRAVQQALNELDVLLNDVQTQQTVPMSSEPRIVDICGIISNELLAIEAAAGEKGVGITVHQCPRTHPECRLFLGDPIRIGQLVKNLLLNAIRYTPTGGAISVDCYRESRAFAFSVQNEGSGISAVDLPHIFESGYRGSTGPTTLGSGMGLTVAKQIVDAHNGTITVDSIEGHGATFTVRLPDTASPCATCATHVRLVEPARHSVAN